MKFSTKYLKKYKFLKKNIKKLPELPGIYLFYDKNTCLYVGKSVSLRSRVRSYCSKSLLFKTKEMMRKVIKFSYITVESDIESILLESKLIKILKPKYNLTSKDDKSPNYITISKDTYPIVKIQKLTQITKKSCYLYGPFLSSTQAKQLLSWLRKVFPFATHKISSRACLYNQLGLCNPCPSSIEKLSSKKEKLLQTENYLKNIRSIKYILKGNLKKVTLDLEKNLRVYSKNKEYEKASEELKKLNNLKIILEKKTRTNDYLKNPNLIEDIRRSELDDLIKIINSVSRIELKSVSRIECYDISHLKGTKTAASMVTFIKAKEEKKFYRHFRIRQSKRSSDTDSIKEVASRRSKHFNDWGQPDLIVVDGGKGQVSSFLKGLKKDIFVVGLAKRHETLIIANKIEDKLDFISIRLNDSPAKYLLQRLRDESHRFAQRYHKNMLRRTFLQF